MACYQTAHLNLFTCTRKSFLGVVSVEDRYPCQIWDPSSLVQHLPLDPSVDSARLVPDTGLEANRASSGREEMPMPSSIEAAVSCVSLSVKLASSCESWKLYYCYCLLGGAERNVSPLVEALYITCLFPRSSFGICAFE